MALFLRIAAAVVVLATIANVIGLLRMVAPAAGLPGGDSILVVMGTGALMMQVILPLALAAILAGLASVIDRLDRRRAGSGEDE